MIIGTILMIEKSEVNLPLLDVHNGDVSCNNVPGSNFTYTFTGSYVALYGETNNDGGEALVEVFKNDETDPIASETINFVSDGRLGMQKVFEKDGLEAGTYTLKATVVGKKYIVVDAIKYIDTSSLQKKSFCHRACQYK